MYSTLNLYQKFISIKDGAYYYYCAYVSAHLETLEFPIGDAH